MSTTPKNERKMKLKKSIMPLNSELNKELSQNNIKEKFEIKEIKNVKRSSTHTKFFYEEKKIKPLEISLSDNIPNLNNNINNIKKPTNNIFTKKNIVTKILTNSNSNLFSNISNLKTRRNSALNITNISENTTSDNIKDKIRSKNYINFKDRLKIKNTKVLGLKLYEQFEEDKRKNISRNKSNDKIIKINSYDTSQRDYQNTSFLDNVMKQYENKKNYKSKRNIKYSLNQLMKMNPYHYVSTRVRYNNAIEMGKISEKLSNVNSVKPYQKTTFKNNFFKENFHQNINTKVLKTVKVQFNNNFSYQGGLVWRVLTKLQKNKISSEFKQICKLQGYTELWKTYGMLLEKLILNYPIFKWFLEKDKLMGENVFREYLQCLKIDINIDESFPRKIFLLFDDTGEGFINIKIFFFIMKLLSSTSDIDKINFYMKLFEDVNRKDKELCINVLEMFEILKYIFTYNGWTKTKNNLLKHMRKEFNDDKVIEKDFYISKNQMINFLLNNKFMNKIFDKFKREYKFAYINYNEKINSIFFNTVRTVQKFLKEQKEVYNICKHNAENLEKILESVQNKEEKNKKNNENKIWIENDE